MVEPMRLPGTGSDDKNQRWFFDFYNQWRGIFGRNNWYDLTLLCLEVEYSPYKGSAEVHIAVLGFRLMVTYLYDRTFNDEMEKRVEEITARLDNKEEIF